MSNTDANNFTRFEGPGAADLSASAPLTVRANAVQSRITVLSNGTASPVHLNKHISPSDRRSVRLESFPRAEARKSLAFPRDMVVSQDGSTLFVSAFGSSKIGVFATQELEDDAFVPSEDDHIVLSGGGPATAWFMCHRSSLGTAVARVRAMRHSTRHNTFATTSSPWPPRCHHEAESAGTCRPRTAHPDFNRHVAGLRGSGRIPLA